MTEWRDVATADRPDENPDTVLVLQDGRRFLAQWDGAAGHWYGLYAIDSVERINYFQEWPGRLYNVTAWAPLPHNGIEP